LELSDLMELVEIDEPGGFSFFEQFAALVEAEADIPFEPIFLLFSGADAHALSELTEGYFQDMLENMPDDQVELHSLMSAIGQNLTGLADLAGKGSSREESLRSYAEEFFRFRGWFLEEGAVACENAVTGDESRVSVLDALTLARLEALGGDTHYYDFSERLDYPLSEYVFSVGAYGEDGD
jgi:hypothetical protein